MYMYIILRALLTLLTAPVSYRHCVDLIDSLCVAKLHSRSEGLVDESTTHVYRHTVLQVTCTLVSKLVLSKLH
jgi:hypothetical protein